MYAYAPKLISAINQANEYFEKEYEINDFFSIGYTYKESCYISSVFHVTTTYNINGYPDLIEIGKEQIKKIDINLRWLGSLQKHCSKLSFEMQDGYTMLIKFFDSKFYIYHHIVDVKFKFSAVFFVSLMMAFIKDDLLKRKIILAQKEYQKFWQYVFKNEFDAFTFAESQLCVDMEIQPLQVSFSAETKQIYNAMVMLHDLKER